ncbi:MAG: hypothetical protein CMP23_05525 [Rickettsiales bacterium]|nr:hypothetical protein [Rickettsiales bacterium]|tara:strand:+ start:5833 stop:6222 length:390 start_codon:yes stop_codon:yes gene_type:complete
MRIVTATAAVAVTMVLLDLLFLGVLAKGFFDAQLGALRAQETVLVAAALFYLQYVAMIVGFAVLPARTIRVACLRGLGIGWLAYATFEFTSWAVIEGWPAAMVPVDIAWGCVLTTVVAGVGRLAAGPPE